ncbi:hypothetical protein DPMN_057565 [Dreissena polymorpha]|uniref:Uncharacterized protein n=1 Tax=Dreissena polymorpha TaxID=45954 RepID=A0A9D4C070_DREPO|nr:hypothetical protein DPMN_057565 [Dreissena polymorpha]
MTSRVFTRKTAPLPPGGHFHDDWDKNVTSRETNVLTKFHENWAKNVTSRVFACFHYILIEKTAPPTGGLVFFTIWTIFELFLYINKTNVLIKFHDDWEKNPFLLYKYKENCPVPPGSHVFQRTRTIFELNSRI